MCTVHYAHKKDDPSVSHTVHARPQFEVIYQETKRMRYNFFVARIIRDWNNLAYDIVHAKSINIFNAKLRHECMNH